MEILESSDRNSIFPGSKLRISMTGNCNFVSSEIQRNQRIMHIKFSNEVYHEIVSIYIVDCAWSMSLEFAPHKPNVDCYRFGCHARIFPMKPLMNFYYSTCVVMSNYIAKGNGQHGCNMHFYRFAGEFQKNREEPWINLCHNLSRSMSLDIAPR